MTPSSLPPSNNKEALLQRWQRHFHGRTRITFQELMYSFRQRVRMEIRGVAHALLSSYFLAIVRNTLLSVRSRFKFSTLGIRMDWFNL
jgi:hypothetical protein